MGKRCLFHLKQKCYLVIKKPPKQQTQPIKLHLLSYEGQRSATANLSNKDLIWDTTIKPGNLSAAWTTPGIHACSLTARTCNTPVNVPTAKLFSNSSLLLLPDLISVLLSFTLRGFHFSLHFYAVCCLEGCQRAPGPAIALGRQAISTILLFAHPQRARASLFSDSPQQCTPKYNI